MFANQQDLPLHPQSPAGWLHHNSCHKNGAAPPQSPDGIHVSPGGSPVRFLKRHDMLDAASANATAPPPERAPLHSTLPASGSCSPVSALFHDVSALDATGADFSREQPPSSAFYLTPNVVIIKYPEFGQQCTLTPELMLLLMEHGISNLRVYNMDHTESQAPQCCAISVVWYPVSPRGSGTLHTLSMYCYDILSWLAGSPNRVAAICSPGGKSRTAFACAMYLISSGNCDSVADCILRSEALCSARFERHTPQQVCCSPTQRAVLSFIAAATSSQSWPLPLVLSPFYHRSIVSAVIIRNFPASWGASGCISVCVSHVDGSCITDCDCDSLKRFDSEYVQLHCSFRCQVAGECCVSVSMGRRLLARCWLYVPHVLSCERLFSAGECDECANDREVGPHFSLSVMLEHAAQNTAAQLLSCTPPRAVPTPPASSRCDCSSSNISISKGIISSSSSSKGRGSKAAVAVALSPHEFPFSGGSAQCAGTPSSTNTAVGSSSTNSVANCSVQQLLQSLPRSFVPSRTPTRAAALSLSPDDFVPTVQQQHELPIHRMQQNTAPSTGNVASSPRHHVGKLYIGTARTTPRRIADEKQSPSAAAATTHSAPN